MVHDGPMFGPMFGSMMGVCFGFYWAESGSILGPFWALVLALSGTIWSHVWVLTGPMFGPMMCRTMAVDQTLIESGSSFEAEASFLVDSFEVVGSLPLRIRQFNICSRHLGAHTDPIWPNVDHFCSVHSGSILG